MEIQCPFKIPDQYLRPAHFAKFFLESIRRYGDAIALIDSKTEWSCTYDEIPICVNSMCDYFYQNNLTNQRVALISLNCPEICFIQLATSVLGLHLIHASPLGTVDELTSILTTAKCEIILTQSEFLTKLQQVAENLSNCKHVLLLPDQKSLLKKCRDHLSNYTYRSNNVIFFSSGTTGAPKAFQVPTERMAPNVIQLSIAPFNAPEHENSKKSQQRTLMVCSLTHIYAVTSTYYALYNGHLIVMTPRFALDKFLPLLEKYKITYLHLVPPMVSFLANDAPVHKYDLSHLHSITSAAAPLPVSIAAKCKDKLQLKDVRQLYGMTEIRDATWTPYGMHNFQSVGILLPGVTAKFVDPDTQQVISGPGEAGELWIAGPHTGGTYFENEKATRETFITENGVTWCRTGDIGHFDELGYIYLNDRHKDLIKFKGLQVSPSEIESILQQSPDVIDCAVIGKPDQVSGEIPVAFVVRKPASSINAETLKNLVKGRLSSYKQLADVIFIKELPRTASGKIQKRLLRNLLLQSNSKL